jgi:Phosphotransferase enzyme family
VSATDEALTRTTVIPYLESRGLLTTGSLGGLKVARRSSLNLSFAVMPRRPDLDTTRAGLFVKQGLGRAGRRGVAHEHAAYRELHGAPDGVSRFIPALVDYDSERGILVLELAGRGRNLHQRRRTARGFSPRLGRVLGEALGCLHDRPPPAPDLSDEARTAAPPWVLRAHRPRPAAFREVSPGDVEVIKLLQQSRHIREGLDGLAAGWRPHVFVHGDFRWENCVVSNVRSARPVTRLVDFERASGGEPALDLGAAFAEYVRCWLSSMPADPALGAAQLGDDAKRPLEEMRPEVAGLWRGYAERRRLDDAERQAVLARSVGFAAVRLIGAAFEQTEEAEHLSTEGGRALQVAENLFSWPWEASARLIGIEQ